MRVVTISNVTLSKTSASKHPSGKRLFECGEWALDNCGVPGDAAVSLKGMDLKTGAVSTFPGAILMNLFVLEAMQAMQDIAYFFASHTQQLMTQETYVNTVGEWQRRLQDEFGTALRSNRMKVTPSDLLIDYDVDCRDNISGNTSDMNFWVQMFQTVAEHPELNAKFDIQRIFEHMARQDGVKNVEEFYRVMPDAQVQDEVQKGNLVPQNAV